MDRKTTVEKVNLTIIIYMNSWYTGLTHFTAIKFELLVNTPTHLVHIHAYTVKRVIYRVLKCIYVYSMMHGGACETSSVMVYFPDS